MKNNDKIEKLALTIQQKLDGNPALLIGSGGSVPYGLPTMEELGKEIISCLSEKYDKEINW